MNLPCAVNHQPHLRQNCRIPGYLIARLGVKILDFVRITCTSEFIIAQVFQGPEVDVIEADCVVSSAYYWEKGVYSVTRIDPLLSVVLDNVRVQVVLHSSQELLKWKNADRNEILVSDILTQYGIVDKCSIKCSDHPVAKSRGIDRINILLTFISGNQVGKVCKRTKIEISEVISKDYYDQMCSFKKISLGGLSHSFLYLKEAIENFYTAWDDPGCGQNEFLLIGPSGCGKTSLAKNAAYYFGAYLEIVKCSKLVNLLPLDCEMYIDSVVKSIDSYAAKQRMLLIDDIDCISSVSAFSDSSFTSGILFNLLMKMRSRNIVVIGTTTSAKELYPEFRVQGIFYKQIRIGVPGFEERKSILHALIPQHDMNPFLDLSAVAKLTPGFVGADLLNAIRSAKHRKKVKKEALHFDQQIERTGFITTDDLKDALLDIKPLILRNVDYDWSLRVCPIQWDSIGGMEKIKTKILKRIEVSLTPQKSSQEPWLPSIGGVLLYGPPGCCKTTLVRALATKWDATFFSANPAQIYSPYVGDSEKSITQLFHQARLCAPAIIFFDELDCLVGKRAASSVNRDIQEKVLSSLLNEMDGVCIKLESMQGEQKTMLMEGDKAPSLELTTEQKSNSGIVVIGATNRPDLIDEALLRPGRFDLLQHMSSPNKKERESILKTILRKVPLVDVDLTWLAAKTKYFSGADLQMLCKMAAGNAFGRNVLQIKVTNADFEDALRKVLPSLSENDLMIHGNFSRMCSREIRAQ